MSYTVPENIADVRARAWQTRRQRYGQRGHAGTYLRGAAPRKMLALLIELHDEEVLSEGQVAQATGLDRPTIRRMVAALPPVSERRAENVAAAIRATPERKT